LQITFFFHTGYFKGKTTSEKEEEYNREKSNLKIKKPLLPVPLFDDSG